MSQFDPKWRGRSWEEQGCIERAITIFFALLVIAMCIGAFIVVFGILNSP